MFTQRASDARPDLHGLSPWALSCHLIRRPNKSGPQILELGKRVKEIIAGTLSMCLRIFVSYATKSKDAQETASCLRRFLSPSQKPVRICTDKSKEFIKTNQDPQWTHDTNTLRRSRIHAIAEKSCPRSEKKEQQLRWFTVALPKKGGTAPWNVIASCRTCTTKWPSPRQHIREDTV